MVDGSGKYKFRSTTEHGLDAKGRLNVPARFKEVLRKAYGDDNLIITRPWRKCLRVYPVQEWAKVEAHLTAKGNANPKMEATIRHLVGGTADAKVDNNGRILVPVNLRSEASISKEVVLVGMVDRFEIWDKAIWDQENAPSVLNFDDLEMM